MKNKEIDSILLVEDESLFILKLQDILYMLEFDTDLVTTANTVDAKEKVKELMVNNQPDVFFIDLNLKGSPMNGLEFGEMLRKNHGKDLILIMLTTSNDQSEKDKAKEIGFNGWITKSGDLEARLDQFRKDFPDFISGKKQFTVYD